MSEAYLYPTIMLDIDKLIPYEDNAKEHPDSQIRKIANSISENGWNGSPIELTPDYLIVSGHGRRLAAMLLEWPQVPVVILEHLTSETAIRKYRLDDNKTAESSYNTDKLATELQFLHSRGVDLLGTFDERDLDFAIKDLGAMNLDAINADISAQVEEQSEKTQRKMDEEADINYSLTKIFGFTKVNRPQNRILSLFVAHIESVTNEVGATALSKFAADFVGIK